MTYNRPRSLSRLLKSLEMADYNFSHNNPEWRIILEIRIDGGGGRDVRYQHTTNSNCPSSHSV